MERFVVSKMGSDIGSIQTAEAIALVKPLHEMMKRYRAKVESQLTPLLDEIRSLEEKLRASLQEVLLRRDYIVYTCRLCPGQLRPLR